MIAGGGSAVFLEVFPSLNPVGESILVALPLSLAVFLGLTFLYPRRNPSGGVSA